MAALEPIRSLGVEPPCDIRRWARGSRQVGTPPLYGGVEAIEVEVLGVHLVGGGNLPWLGDTYGRWAERVRCRTWCRAHSPWHVGHATPPWGSRSDVWSPTAVPRLKSLENSARIVGGWVWVKRPFEAGLSGRNQDRPHLPIHGSLGVGNQPRATLYCRNWVATSISSRFVETLRGLWHGA